MNSNTNKTITSLWNLRDKFEDLEHEICGDAALLIKSLQTRLAKSLQRERVALDWIQTFTESIDQPCIACENYTNSPVSKQICEGCGRMGSRFTRGFRGFRPHKQDDAKQINRR